MYGSVAKDCEYYTQNGLLGMLERNMKMKPRPERFQASTERFDLIVTVEERVFDLVLLYTYVTPLSSDTCGCISGLAMAEYMVDRGFAPAGAGPRYRMNVPRPAISD